MPATRELARPHLGRVHKPDARDNNFPARDVIPRVAYATRRYWAGSWWGDQGQTEECFPPETRIMMADGSEKPIKEILAGDEVITHRGRSRMVTSVMVRRFEGELTGLKVRGVHDPLWSTPNHPYLTTRFKTVDVGHHGSHRAATIQPIESAWVAAEECHDRYLHIPIGGVSDEVQSGDFLDLKELIPELLVSADGTRVRAWGRREANSLPRWIEISPFLAWFIGLYLAEGSANSLRSDMTLSLASYEEDTLGAQASKILKEIFEVEPYYQHRPNHSLVVHAGSSTLAMVMKTLGGAGVYSHQVHPSLFSWSANLLGEIWRGWCDGDGHRREKREEGVTVSPRLARDMWRIGLRAGLAPVIHWDDSPLKRGRKRRYTVTTYENPSFTRRPRDEESLYLKVQTVEKKPYDGLVFNLEVEDDHSYVAEMAVVHNCTAFSWTAYIMDGTVEKSSTTPLIIPEDLYSEEQQIDGLQHAALPDNTDQSGGSTVRAGAKVLAQRGLLSAYHWAFDADAAVRAVLTIGPVVLGTAWLNNMFNPGPNGVLDVSGDPAGGHAYLMDGANTTKGIVRIKNSWGRDWGIQGYGFMKITDLDTLIKSGGEACLPIETQITAPRPFDPNAAELEPN